VVVGGGGGGGETSSFLVPSILQVLASHVKLDFEPIKTFPIEPRESFLCCSTIGRQGLN